MARARKPRITHSALVAALMIVHAILLLAGMRWNFATLDEAAHVPAGIAHWETGDFSLYRVNPPLYRMIAALPALLARPYATYIHLDHRPGARAEVIVGSDFAQANAPRYFKLICLARLPGVAWSLLGAWIIYRWCRELYGGSAGCLAVAMWVFDPTVLAFAGVVTADIPAAVAGFVATYVFWHWLRIGSWRLACWSGLLLGVAQLTKFTLVIMYVVWPLIALVRYLGWRGATAVSTLDPMPMRSDSCGASLSRADNSDGTSPSAPSVKDSRYATGNSERLGLQTLAMVLLSLGVINLGYFFRDTGRSLGTFAFVSEALAGASSDSAPEWGNRFHGSWLGHLVVPVPADYLLGIDVQKRDFEVGMPSYLAGEWRERGWWYYYAYALAVKEPLGTLALVVWALVLVLARLPTPGFWRDELPVLLPAAAIMVLVSSQTGFSRYMRYILPVFPFVAVAAGRLAHFLRPGRPWARAVVLGLLVWSVVSSLLVYPHSMSYFNELAGGPANGHNHLLDGNIDWGQDLLSLRELLPPLPADRPGWLLGLHLSHNAGASRFRAA